MSIAVPFPDTLPSGYSWFEDEVPFDSGRHLALEPPTSTVSLAELGYEEDEIATKATSLGVSAPFRVLSDEGVSMMLETARRLRPFCHAAGDRIERMTRGGCFRSRWLRDLCVSPEVNELLGEVYGTDVSPHPMPAHLGHINFDPSAIRVGIDRWHHDTLPLDYVMMVTDPATVDGGEFEYFVGTKTEMAELAANGETPPEGRVVRPTFPGAGYAVALHGDMIVHRAAPMNTLGERITMVNGYIATDYSREEQSRSRDLIHVDDPEFLWTDWAKFAAWRSQGRLTKLIDDLAYTADRDAVIEQLEFAIASAQTAIDEMRAGPGPIQHYEKPEGE